jgi:glycosyltransferase involved in cell wall biosynthesis
VLCQSAQNWELLLIDDGSTDGTKDKIAKYLDDPRIRYYYKENAGVSLARNYGAEKAKGKYLYFLDSDDEIRSDTMQFFDKLLHKKYDCICTAAIFIKNNGIEVLHNPKNRGPLFKGQRCNFFAGTFLIKKEVFLALGGYDGKLIFGENDELGIRIARNHKIHAYDQVTLLSHREEVVQKNQKFNRQRYIQSLLHYFKKYREVFKSEFPQEYTNTINRLAVNYHATDSWSDAIKILLNNLKFWSLKSLKIFLLILLFKNRYKNYLRGRGII